MLLSFAAEILLLFKRLSLAKRRAGGWVLRDGVFTLKPDMGFGEASKEEEAIGCKWVFKKKKSNIRKRERKFQGSPSSKGLFIAKMS